MDKNIQNILKEKIKKFKLKNTELCSKIEKSILQNNNIKNNIKLYSKHTIVKKTIFLSRQHKVCIFTGKRSGVLKGFSFSRYKLKSLILNNWMTNLKKNNW